MRFYKLAGSEQYVSWDTLHNVSGYSEQATNEITWKSVENWGTSAGTGYELPVELFGDSELFMNDVFGWHDLDCFALEVGVYPSSASDMVLTHPTYGSSPVVFMVFDDGTYYLIQKDISQGWMTEEEYTERGWQLPNFIIIDANGQIKSSIQYTPNTFTGTGHVELQDSNEIAETGTGHVALQDASEVVFVENITPPTQILAYQQDGTTSTGYARSDMYQIDAIGPDFYSETEINALGWYVKWQILTTTNSSHINIRDNPSLYYTNIIGQWTTADHPIGSPFSVTQGTHSPGTKFIGIKFTTDGGATIQTGWTVCYGNETITSTYATSATDVMYL